jgi:hypothetical protein
MRAQRELEEELHRLGWSLEGPTRTPGGWKATIKRGTTSMLATGSTELEVLEDLLRDAHAHGGQEEP